MRNFFAFAKRMTRYPAALFGALVLAFFSALGVGTAMLAMVQVKDRYDPAQIRASVNERFSPAAVGKAFVAIYQRSLSSRA